MSAHTPGPWLECFCCEVGGMSDTMTEIARQAIAVDAAIRTRYQAKKIRSELFREWNDGDSFYDSSALGDDCDPEIEAAISIYKEASATLRNARAKLSKTIRSAA